MSIWSTKKDSHKQRYFGRFHKSKKLTIHKTKKLMNTNQRCCNYNLRYLASDGQKMLGGALYCTPNLSKHFLLDGVPPPTLTTDAAWKHVPLHTVDNTL